MDEQDRTCAEGTRERHIRLAAEGKLPPIWERLDDLGPTADERIPLLEDRLAEMDVSGAHAARGHFWYQLGHGLGALVTVVLLGAVFGARALGDLVMAMFFGAGTMLTHSMTVLFAMFSMRVFWSFVSLYLLSFTMRIFALLYLTKKAKFGWHGR